MKKRYAKKERHPENSEISVQAKIGLAWLGLSWCSVEQYRHTLRCTLVASQAPWPLGGLGRVAGLLQWVLALLTAKLSERVNKTTKVIGGRPWGCVQAKIIADIEPTLAIYGKISIFS